jgi:hypothetical protein
MSGWTEHAEAICKVLNDLQPDHPVSNLTNDANWAQFEQYCAAAEERLCSSPYAADFSPLEARAAEHYVRQCEGRKPPKKRAVTPEQKALNEWVEYGQTIYKFAQEQEQKLAAVTAELEEVTTQLKTAEEKLAKPVEVSGNLAQAIFSCVPGVHILSSECNYMKFELFQQNVQTWAAARGI